MGIRIGVVAHEKRIWQAYNIFDTVEADFMHIDNGSMGCTENHRHVWKSLCDMANEDDFLIVIEDDAVVAPWFREQAEMALDAVPDDVDVVSFYLGRLRPQAWQPFIEQALAQADSTDACWITSSSAIHAVCLAIRNRELAETMLICTEPFRHPIDERITLWCRQFGHKSAYSVPSLVDHADEEPIITGRPGRSSTERGRVAWRVGTRHRWMPRSVMMRP